ncbi:hypothetical protein CP557_04620 [Natrinema ejinorense]|uniref:C2H2-type domain-containing protein n=1 Tax=Natrinema ejinorense TaxID=373386 RepID=A0A2A5R0I9_9EURY|nr:hypothetical protein CP557_04620 [Natrinema ejinorense]
MQPVVVAPTVPGDPRGHAPAVDSAPGERFESDARGGQPTVRCPYCDRPFRRTRYESLHRGLEHSGRLSDRERAAAERAARTEQAAYRRVRLYALATLVSLYFGLLIVAAFVV